MISKNNISKFGLIGAVVGALTSVFTYKSYDSVSKKIVKTGLFSVIGYLLGAFADKKVNQRNQAR